jgi:hypothetical protein
MTWDYLLCSPAFQALKSGQASPVHGSPGALPDDAIDSPASEAGETDSEVRADGVDGGALGEALARPPPPPLGEEEEEEPPPPPASPPHSPERYLDHRDLEGWEDAPSSEGYEEAFMLDFVRAWRAAVAGFVRESLAAAFENTTKPVSQEAFWELRVAPIARFAVGQVAWADEPGSAEHMAFARNAVAPGAALLATLFSEVKRRRWG